MRYKIYAKGNYLYIQNMDVGEIFTGFKKEVFVDKTNVNKSIYRFFNVKDWDFKKSLKIEEIYKEDGSLYTEVEFDTFYLENTGNSGGQDLSGYLLKANNLSDLDSAPIARNNLGLGTLATQNGIFSGESSGTNTGDETTSSIQTKRPLKTVNNQSLEGVGNITAIIKLTKVEILSSDLTTQDVTGFLTYINSVTSFSIASNERVRYVVTDTGQIFDIEVNNRSIGSGEIAITLNEVTEVEKTKIFKPENYANWRNLRAEALGGNQSTITFSGGMFFINTGTVALRPSTYNTTNFIDTVRRVGLVSASTAGSSVQRFPGTGVQCSRLSGFYFCADSVFSDPATVVTARSAIGIGDLAGGIGNVEPSTKVACILLAKDSTDSNMQIMHNDNTGVCTKIDLGSNFPATTNNTDVYRLELFCLPNGVSIYYKVTRLNSGHVAEGTLSSNIPLSDTPLLFIMWRNNGTTALPVAYDFSQVIISTPY